MLEKTALGKRPIFGRAFQAMLGGAPGVQAHMIVLIRAIDAMDGCVAFRQKGEAN